MGLAEHQVIYALHRDTKNCHLHVAVNRVHPDSEKLVTVNNGFDHEVAHRAIARIERDQGWQREGRALFVARPDGDLERSRPRGQRERQPSGPARDFEERVGERSAQRIALEVAAPIIRDAAADFTQWQTLDGCKGAPAPMNGVCQTVSGCGAGVEVTLCSIASGHVLYADAAAAGAGVADVAWAAFARHTLP